MSAVTYTHAKVVLYATKDLQNDIKYVTDGFRPSGSVCMSDLLKSINPPGLCGVNSNAYCLQMNFTVLIVISVHYIEFLYFL